jgi:hypothetical protein
MKATFTSVDSIASSRISPSANDFIIAPVVLAASMHALVAPEEKVAIERATASSKRSGFVASTSFTASLSTYFTLADPTASQGAMAEICRDDEYLLNSFHSCGSMASNDSVLDMLDKVEKAWSASVPAGTQPSQIFSPVTVSMVSSSSNIQLPWSPVQPAEHSARRRTSACTLDTTRNIGAFACFASSNSAAALAAPCAPADGYASGTMTHAQQLAHLYAAARDAEVPIYSLLELLSAQPDQLFASPMATSPSAPTAEHVLDDALHAIGTSPLSIDV